MYNKLREYDDKISDITNTVSRNIDLYEITIKVNECIELYVVIGMELFNYSMPSLSEGPKLREIKGLHIRREKNNHSPQKIVEGIRNILEDSFSKILREELKNPRRRTARRMLLENNFYELTCLFSLVNGLF